MTLYEEENLFKYNISHSLHPKNRLRYKQSIQPNAKTTFTIFYMPMKSLTCYDVFIVQEPHIVGSSLSCSCSSRIPQASDWLILLYLTRSLTWG